jgi:hypothetical protein
VTGARFSEWVRLGAISWAVRGLTGLAAIDDKPTLLIWHQWAMQRRESSAVVLFLLPWRLGATNQAK